MQDKDAPPVVEEGETGGGAVVAPEAEIRPIGMDAINTAEFSPVPWTTVTVPRWQAATTVRAQDAHVRALPPVIRRRIPNRCPCAKTLLLASSVLSTTFSFRRNLRKPRASRM